MGTMVKEAQRTAMLLTRIWALAKATVEGFIEDEAMTRGAAIACYTLFSIAPLLVVAVAIASTIFAETAVWDAVTAQLHALVGEEGAAAVQGMVRGVDSGGRGGGLPALLSLGLLLLTASGVFAEIQAALNVIWKAAPNAVSISYLVRARLLSIGLVAATGFLLLVSLLASAAVAAVEAWARGRLPGLSLPLQWLGFAISFALTTALFAAIYKILPDRRLQWRDVIAGAVATAFLFTLGKTLIGWYIGGSGLARSYGAAGALVVVLLWVYYSAQIFLLGAELTRAWAGLEGSQRQDPVEPARAPGNRA
ncbi:YihY/virulence factor BrkB family protein [Sabulicella glaciei]|uniref:YihY/virulence factor BrkB family protein n=1 Tax=Sabulicella glaciei TaxID=2984948 RepID=A0ABT3NU78_9PROT|nr:YihY/virulence factor BrkB family protein [Roseococcus sp. MDT2-1-1]MCW8085717.1 YihY/virulence factor BrkB family protein [Roseococcus sp. MDT2-1-1]